MLCNIKFTHMLLYFVGIYTIIKYKWDKSHYIKIFYAERGKGLLNGVFTGGYARLFTYRQFLLSIVERRDAYE